MTADWTVSPGETEPLSAAVQSVMVATRAQPGCVSCSLSTQLGERTRFHYEEEWRTESDLNLQLNSGRFARLAHLMESSMERPRIEFQLPDGTRGIEYAEEVRRGPRELP
jgi:quinol monooxygenase YgiN